MGVSTDTNVERVAIVAMGATRSTARERRTVTHCSRALTRAAGRCVRLMIDRRGGVLSAMRRRVARGRAVRRMSMSGGSADGMNGACVNPRRFEKHAGKPQAPHSEEGSEPERMSHASIIHPPRGPFARARLSLRPGAPGRIVRHTW